MASIRVNTNINSVIGNITEKIKVATNPEYLLRPICFDIIELLSKRIHIDGKNSSGAEIGKYSSSYLKLRERNNRTEGRKVVISLTRQLENDYAVIATDKGYGVGFNNRINREKVNWVQDKYGRIFGLTTDELNYVRLYAEDLINAALK